MTAIRDQLIRAGVEAAIAKTLDRAITQDVYPGHFTVTATGNGFGTDTTWPGLDSWEMAGAYLLLGREQLVRDYFRFVKAAQRADGNIPFAIFSAEPPPAREGYLQGLDYANIHTDPVTKRKWIGLFHHWQSKANPLSVLGPISHVLTAAAIFKTTRSHDWLRENLSSVERAAEYVLSRQSPNGLIGGAGFYLECPPRHQWDGITQCYAVQAFRQLASLWVSLGDQSRGGRWDATANELTATFQKVFWRGNHFAEYVHPERGVVDTHGLSDVNWAALAWDVATADQCEQLWPLLMNEPAFRHGEMPTQVVTKPFTYEPWELPEPLTFKIHNPLHDVAAMGRVWYLEALACLKMGATERVVESVRQVCRMGQQHDWLWYERYHPQPDGTVQPAGPAGYCEYAAILVRIVLGNRELFTQDDVVPRAILKRNAADTRRHESPAVRS